jgi:hypothetical protein
MENLFTSDFDNQFKSRIPHLENYPEMLPFVGRKWNESSKILLIGESHFMPFDELKLSNITFDFFNDWYNGKSIDLNENYRNYIRTKRNIETVEGNEKRKRTLNIYYNLKSALKEIGTFENERIIFDKFAFYNYFQKPAYAKEEVNENRSITPTTQDNIVAYRTFTEIVGILNVKTVIFISRKSYNSFVVQRQQGANSTEIFSNIRIDFVPHAGRPWWNKASRQYALTGENIKRTGKEKFIAIVKDAIKDN